MRTVIIGGSGHVGTYLVPRLIKSGFEVINVCRGESKPYLAHKAWKQVQTIILDRYEEERKGRFGKKILALKPDVVIDMICFTMKSTKHIVRALKGNINKYLFCGTIWVHGHSVTVPTTEDQPRFPFGEYGIQKEEIERFLLNEAVSNIFPVTILHPGHIVGPGYIPVNPAGNKNPEVFSKLAKGRKVAIPNIGMETVHHVHADDVAQSFMKAIQHWDTARGECFHVVSSQAITLKGYAEAMAEWFGKKANLEFISFDKWKRTVPKKDAQITWDHIAHSPNCSIEKAKKLIKYKPAYSSLEAVYESVEWLVRNGVVEASEKLNKK